MSLNCELIDIYSIMLNTFMLRLMKKLVKTKQIQQEMEERENEYFIDRIVFAREYFITQLSSDLIYFILMTYYE